MQTFYDQLETCLRKDQDRLYRLAYSYAGTEQDALDILQTAMVKALTAAPLREPQYLGTWVYRIVINTALDWLRARKRLVTVESAFFDDVSDGALPDALSAGDAAHGTALLDDQGLYRALDELPTDYKTVVVLRYLQELRLQEVADVLQLNVNTVKTRLYRALQMLRINMEEDDNA